MSDVFNSSRIQTEENKPSGGGKYISFGVQVLKINKIEVVTASTGSKKIVFNMEGKPSTEANFEGIDGAKGAVGKVSTSYMKPEQEKDILSVLAKIADVLGVREALDKITAGTLEAYIEKASVILSGKFANFAIGSQQYINKKGYAADNLKFLKYNFVEAVNTTPSMLTFDKNNKYHFEAAVKPDNIGTPESATFVKPDNNDLPF